MTDGSGQREDIEIRSLLEAIYHRFHYDFRGYAMASVRRRVTAATVGLGCPTIPALEEKVLREPDRFPALLQYLTVQVSDLFRDPAFFQAFREQVVPELRTYPSFKVWIAGCATGEEVYSLAIILREEGLLERALIYATDISAEALKRAESGVYPLDRVAAFSDNYRLAGGRLSLSEYYTAAYQSIIMSRALRSHVVFSDHSLATDSVFAEVQVVTCRNVLIYFDRALQNRALGLFKDALCRRGYLGLGGRESLSFSRVIDDFEPVVPALKWYRRC